MSSVTRSPTVDDCIQATPSRPTPVERVANGVEVAEHRDENLDAARPPLPVDPATGSPVASAFSRVRFQTTTSWPAAAMFRAIGRTHDPRSEHRHPHLYAPFMIVAHLDLDAFFAAVEELENPSLAHVSR